MTEKTVEVGGRAIELSSLDKVMYPRAGITKGDVIDYYRRIADVMVPHLRGHPISMQAFPKGIDEGGFYRKEAPDYFPGWIRRVSVYVEEDDEEQPQVVPEDAATLVYLANQNVVTFHPWLSEAERLDYPQRLIFDLDPPGGDFEVVRYGARVLHDALEELGLAPFLMTTGSRGLHVVAPIQPTVPFDEAREFTRDLAEVLVRRHPERFTVEMRKKERGDRLFLDYLRNAYAQTAVAPYSLRAKPGAPVATPIDWHELDRDELHSQSYTLDNIFRRLGQKEDPWAEMEEQAPPLDEARERLESWREEEGL
jgi:bifunctional non-homologous end joining protein LigD